MSALLTVDRLTKRFAAEIPPAVDRLSFAMGDDEVFALVGPSGCGKTTTLRLIAGLETPDAGTVDFEGRRVEGEGTHVPPEARRVGLVFQDFAIFPHMTVLRNVLFGLKRWPRRHRRARAMEALRLVGLENEAGRMPQSLSTGQQQRVALARSMAPAPRLLLLDEPFSNLDAARRQETRAEVRSLLKRNGMSALLVTHDQEEALSFSDRLGVMREGRVLQTGPPERVYHKPADAFVAEFLGGANLLTAEAHGEEARSVIGPLRLDRSASGPVRVSLRAEHLSLEAADPHRPTGEVTDRAFKGHDLTLKVACNGQEVVVQTMYDCPFRIGDRVSFVQRDEAVVIDG